MEAPMVQVLLPGKKKLNGTSHVKRKGSRKAADGHKTGEYSNDGRWKRSAESIKRQVATAARNRAKALREGRSYGHTLPPGGARSAGLEARKSARKARGQRIGDALVYLSLAQRKALGAYSHAGGGETLGELIGLLALSIAALEGRD